MPPSIRVSPGASRSFAKTDLTIGVSGHGERWRVHEGEARPHYYDTREGAVTAAQEHALAAARAGQCVEFFLQEEDGTLKQTVIAAVAPVS